MPVPTVVPTQGRQSRTLNRAHSRHTSLQAAPLSGEKKGCAVRNLSADLSSQGTITPKTTLTSKNGLHGGSSKSLGKSRNQVSLDPCTSTSVSKDHGPIDILQFSAVPQAGLVFDGNEYTDRWGKHRIVLIPSQDEQQVKASVLPSTLSAEGTPREQFKAFGIEAHPTRALNNEICRDFVSIYHRCHRGYDCFRIHPLDKGYYRRQIFTKNHDPTGHVSENYAENYAESSDTKPISADSGKQGAPVSGMNGVPRIELPLSGQPLNRLNVQKKGQEMPFAPSNKSSHEIKDPKTTVGHKRLSDAVWDSQTGVWDYPVDTSAWTDPGSSSDDSSLGSSIFHTVRTTSSRSSVVDETQTQTAPNDEVKYPRPQYSELCRDWLQGRCCRAYCSWVHEDRAYEDHTTPTTTSHSSVVNDVQTKTTLNGDIKYPRPRSLELCRDWLHGRCYQTNCPWMHEDREYVGHTANTASSYSPVAIEAGANAAQNDGIKYLRPQSLELCRDWLHGRCCRKYCQWVHEDREYKDVTPTVPPAQARPEICKQWLQGHCSRINCWFTHDNRDATQVATALSFISKQASEQDLRVPQSSLGFIQAQRSPALVPKKPTESLWTTVHDHIKLNLGAGFEVRSVTTGFETSWISLGNVPSWVTEEQIIGLVQTYGGAIDVRLPTRAKSSTLTVNVHLSTAEGASKACAVLNGMKAFDTTITCRLYVNNSTKAKALLRDTTVRIQWEAPGKVGYGGYPNLERANDAIAATNIPYGDNYVKANIHSGLPVVSAVTVRFQGLPLDADIAGMSRFAEPEDIMWERPKYTSLERAINGVKRFLEDDRAQLLQLDVSPPPYRDGMIRAFAHFASPVDAEAACKHLHGRKPAFTGLMRITARHVKSISYAINGEIYAKLSSDINELSRTVGRDWRGRTSVSIPTRTSATSVNIKLCGEDVKELARLKLEFEKILAGEVVRDNGKVSWDDFFGRPAGFAFLQDLERAHASVRVEKNISRRTLRLFGPSSQRTVVRQKILDKLSQLGNQRVHVILLDRRFIGSFLSTDLAKLQEDLGPENVVLNSRRWSLDIRGDDLAYKSALEVVNAARQRHRSERLTIGAVCPVCLDAVSLPVSLDCGHSWCRSCLEGYLRAAMDQKFFPLTCLGNDAQCAEKIPLEIARSILPVHDFDAVMNAAFSAHVHTHPDKFHFCPSPDCPQVYRSASQGTVLQCPSCLIRICPSCQSEAHDGLACIEADGGEALFKEWAKSHNVKNCPGCNIAIERVEGCNHVTCTQCQTHVCWVCMETFPRGDGIYGHMRKVHGGFGIGVTE